MLGFISSVAFQNVTVPVGESIDPPRYPQWRWMLASTAIPPMFVMAQVYLCPESPRWYMEKGRYDRAFRSFMRLRSHPIQAARDMYYAYKLLEVEKSQREGRNVLKEFFTVRRNRRAAQSSFFVMFMQQCESSLHLIPPRPVSDCAHGAYSLRRQCHCVLLHQYLPRSRLYPLQRPPRLHGYWYCQFPLRHTCNLHHRHVRTSEPAHHHVPSARRVAVFHRIFVLPHRRAVSRSKLQRRSSCSHRPWHLLVHGVLFARRRTCTFHLFS